MTPMTHTLPITISIPIIHLTGPAIIPQICVLERSASGQVESFILSPANQDVELAQAYQRLGEASLRGEGK